MRSHFAGFALTAVALIASGCIAQDDGRDPARLSAGLEAKLNRLLHKVHYSKGPEYLADLRQISAFGNYAIDSVKEKMLESDDPRLRSGAVFVLGEIYRLDGNPDALEIVRTALADQDQWVRLESARALLECGERSGVPILIDGLEAEARGVRIRSFLALSSATGDGFGYQADRPTSEREPAVDRFRKFFGANATPPAAKPAPALAVSEPSVIVVTPEVQTKVEAVTPPPAAPAPATLPPQSAPESAPAQPATLPGASVIGSGEG